MKKILYFLPFILYTIFYMFIIILDGSMENLAIIDVILLLGALFICGLGTSNNKKSLNVIGIISLFALSFGLIKMGIDNTYFLLAETKIAIAILLYYLIIFIIYKNKALIIMNLAVIIILSILFVPKKLYVNDGGTEEYRALAYKYIKWNTKRNDGTPLTGNEVHWFPHNFHSLEYYKPVESPTIAVFSKNQQLICNKGSFHWSKTVDGEKIMLIADVFANPIEWIYKDSLNITDDNIVKINSSYNINNVKYTKYEKDTIETIFSDLDFDNENKTLDLNGLEKGTYIITFSIHNDEEYADYAFKVERREI